jgi:hypothetical protein
LPNIISENTSLGFGHGVVVDQEGAEDEGVAEQKDPHHRLAPGHALERALVR